MFTPDVIADPYSYYGRMRDEDPVHWNEKYELWAITRYDDLTWLTRHHELFSSAVFKNDPRPAYPAIDESDLGLYEYVKNYQADQFIQHDRPEHLEMRRVLHSFFTPKSMEAWRPFVQTAVKELLDAAEEKGEMDVMRDLATPLPVLVIAEMMGVPPEDRHYIRELAEKLLYIGRGEYDRMKPLTEGMRGMIDYVSPLVDERIVNPGDDFISVLASGEKKGVFTRHRGAGQHVAAAAGRARDDDQPALQRHAGVSPAPRSMGAASSRTRAAWRRRRPRNACAMIRRSSRSSGSPRRMWRCAARCCARTIASAGSFRRPIAIPTRSRTRTSSTSRGSRTSMSRSARACIIASARPWRGSRVRRCSRRWRSVSPPASWSPEDLEYQPSITFRSLKSLPVTWQ